MKVRRNIPVITMLLSLVFSVTPAVLAASDQVNHWSYEGEKGPEHWADISADFHMCRDGRNQSPINLQENIPADLPELVFDYVGLLVKFLVYSSLRVYEHCSSS